MDKDLFERRRADRRYTLNFLEYEILSEEGEVVGQGMARTVNVSESGLLLETGAFFDPGQQLRITLGLKDDLVRVSGRVMHSEPVDDELCSAGVMFVAFSDDDREVFGKHIAALQESLPR